MVETLIYGYGNPGREDDGLGISFADRIQAWIEKKELPGFHFDRNYQLNIEDALEVSKFDLVLFADATIEPVEDFLLTRIAPSDAVNFSMHAVSPSYIAHLSQSIFGRLPAVYLLHLKGYHWKLREGLSAGAQRNLDRAVSYLQAAILGGDHLEHSLMRITQRNETENNRQKL